MKIQITDMNGHQLEFKRPHGMKFALEINLTLNDGSDPTQIQLQFDQQTIRTLEAAIGFFS